MGDMNYAGLRFKAMGKAKYTTKCQIAPGHRIEEGTKFGLVFADEEADALGFGCEICLKAITEVVRDQMLGRA